LGVYFLFLAYFGVLSLFIDGGFIGAAVKRISEGYDKNEYFTAFIVLRTVFIVTVLILLIIFKNYFADIQDSSIFSFLLIALLVSSIYGALQGGVAGAGKMGVHATSNFINNVARVIIQVLAVYFGYEALGLVGGFVGGMLIGCLIDIKYIDLAFSRFSWKHIKSLSTFSFWLFLTSSGVIAYSYADTIMIGYYMDDADVGIYRVVFQFASLALIVTTELRGVLWPKSSYWSASNQTELIEKSMSKAFSYSLLLPIPILMGGVVLGDKLLYFLYGEDFATGYDTLVLLLLVQIINVFQVLYTMYLGSLDRQEDAFKVTAFAAFINVILNVLLIPVLGILGAAVATFVSMAINAYLAGRLLSKSLSIELDYHSIATTVKAATIMAGIVGFYRFIFPLTNIWITLFGVLFGVVIYGVLIIKLERNISNDFKKILSQISNSSVK
jgi:O-antigen/teichoic acid export membrane protein